jgi:hypothetical protein
LPSGPLVHPTRHVWRGSVSGSEQPRAWSCAGSLQLRAYVGGHWPGYQPVAQSLYPSCGVARSGAPGQPARPERDRAERWPCSGSPTDRLCRGRSRLDTRAHRGLACSVQEPSGQLPVRQAASRGRRAARAMGLTAVPVRRCRRVHQCIPRSTFGVGRCRVASGRTPGAAPGRCNCAHVAGQWPGQ